MSNVYPVYVSTQTKNQDGLIYLDVEISPASRNTGKTLIIHGLEEKTNYASVAFGKVGEQAPDSDEDVATQNQ